MSADKKPPIIKKVIKKGHGGHHGGSWKVAYADFVTALMAFFLVMWLLAISSEKGREALADYFQELTMYDAVFNGGLPSAFTEGGSKGASVLDGGCFQPSAESSTIPVEDQQAQSSAAVQQQVALLVKSTKDMIENVNSLPEGKKGGEGAGDSGVHDVPPEQLQQELAGQVQQQLGPEAASQVMVEKTKGGVRIQIVDKEGRPLFRSAGSALTQEGRDLLSIVAQRLLSIPNKISIEGHTDALVFSGQKVTNWELSTARASAARIFLAQSGIDEQRITMVAGYAATQPLPDTDPNDPINRRISIMIWDEDKAPESQQHQTAQTGPESSGAMGASGPASEGLPTNTTGTGETQTPLQSQQNNQTNTAVEPKTQSVPTATQNANEQGSTSQPNSSIPMEKPLPRPQPKESSSSSTLSGDALEQMLIKKVMEKSSTPDLSTVGPPVKNNGGDYNKQD